MNEPTPSPQARPEYAAGLDVSEPDPKNEPQTPTGEGDYGPACHHQRDRNTCKLKCVCGHECADHPYGACEGIEGECDCNDFQDEPQQPDAKLTCDECKAVPRTEGHAVAYCRTGDRHTGRHKAACVLIERIHPKQPDALARLEAWLAAGENRECTIEFVIYGSALREWEIELSAGDNTVNRVGDCLAATILAALEKAGEHQL